MAPAQSIDFFAEGRLTGLMLFETEKKEDINQAAASRAAVDGVRAIGRYQTCKMEAWNALADDEREAYEDRAMGMKMDVALNQKQFSFAMWEKMTDICEGGRFGQMEIMVLYGYREPGGGLKTGV